MHFKKLDLNLLVVFSALMTHRSVTRAAEDLCVTQPAVSHALTRLREYYSDPLFYYVKGTMVPSSRAEAIFRSISEALGIIDKTFNQEFDPTSLRKEFRIALVDYEPFLLVPALMAKLCAQAPGVKLSFIRMDERNAKKMLINRDLELAIGIFSHPTTNECLQDTIAADEFVCIAKSGNRDKNAKLTLDEYVDSKHICFSFYENLIESTLRRQGIKRKYCVDVCEPWSVPFLVSKSSSLATIPKRIAAVFSQLCSLSVLELPFSIEPFRVDLVWHNCTAADPADSWLRQLIMLAGNDIYHDLGISEIDPACAPPSEESRR